MKLTCKYSGVTYTVSFFGGVRNFTGIHPIFEVPVKILLSRVPEFLEGKLNPIEKRLLYLAILNSTQQLEWRVTATPSDATINQSFEHLVQVVGWLHLYEYNHALKRRSGPSFARFVISQETKSLSNIKHWLNAWEESRAEYEAGSRREEIKSRIRRREAALEKLIKNSQRDPESYANLIAQWAADATDFPTNIQVGIRTTEAGVESIQKMSLRDYWISIMTSKNIYEIREADIAELEEHLVDNLTHGSIFATEALRLVRRKQNAVKSSLGLGDIFGLSEEEVAKLESTPFTIVQDDIERDNIAIITANAPQTEPARHEYISNTDYLRARAKWILANRGKS